MTLRLNNFKMNAISVLVILALNACGQDDDSSETPPPTVPVIPYSALDVIPQPVFDDILVENDEEFFNNSEKEEPKKTNHQQKNIEGTPPLVPVITEETPATPHNTAKVEKITGTISAFLAQKDNNESVIWGLTPSISAVADDLKNDIIALHESESGLGFSFAALKKDGRVITWGNPLLGGNSDNVASQLKDIISIQKNGGAFAALRRDGKVITWGSQNDGGNSSSVALQLTKVHSLYSTKNGAFAALKKDGSVITWGMPNFGGDASKVASPLKNVKSIVSNPSAFAAIKQNGTVVSWGHSKLGGNSIPVASKLTKVTAVVPNEHAFAAIKQDGTVITWGVPDRKSVV